MLERNGADIKPVIMTPINMRMDGRKERGSALDRPKGTLSTLRPMIRKNEWMAEMQTRI